jgi:heme exporter protein D
VQFDSVAAALAMDGHGAYVWFVFAVAAMIAVALIVVPTLRHRRVASQTLGMIRRQQGQSMEERSAPGS